MFFVLSLAQLSQLQSEKIDEYYNTKYPIQRKKHTFIWGNPADVRASFYDSDKFKLLDIVSKSTPDYLPGDKSNKENKYVLYEEFVLGHTELLSIRILSWRLTAKNWTIRIILCLVLAHQPWCKKQEKTR